MNDHCGFKAILLKMAFLSFQHPNSRFSLLAFCRQFLTFFFKKKTFFQDNFRYKLPDMALNLVLFHTVKAGVLEVVLLLPWIPQTIPEEIYTVSKQKIFLNVL